MKKEDIKINANEKTYWKKKSKDEVIKFALNLSNDPLKNDRLKSQLCVYCFYQENQLAGQAFTNNECKICLKLETYSSTLTDSLCLDCAKEHTLCKHCGCQINMKTLR